MGLFLGRTLIQEQNASSSQGLKLENYASVWLSKRKQTQENLCRNLFYLSSPPNFHSVSNEKYIKWTTFGSQGGLVQPSGLTRCIQSLDYLCLASIEFLQGFICAKTQKCDGLSFKGGSFLLLEPFIQITNGCLSGTWQKKPFFIWKAVPEILWSPEPLKFPDNKLSQEQLF